MQNLLAENGAEVHFAHSIAKIPSSLIEEAVKKAPEEMRAHTEIDQIIRDCEKSML
jgi:trimethylamine:corrinoid methyltransferase-like protein